MIPDTPRAVVAPSPASTLASTPTPSQPKLFKNVEIHLFSPWARDYISYTEYQYTYCIISVLDDEV